MTVNKKKMRFLSFLLSLTVLMGFLGANNFIFAEPPTDTSTAFLSDDEESFEQRDESITSQEIFVEDSLGAASSQTRSEPYETYGVGDFPDGIYALRSDWNYRWMDIQQNLTSPGAHVQQYLFNANSPSETLELSGLFRITKVGDTNRYIIRLMLNENLTFTYDSNGDVVTKTIPANDANVDINDTFYITFQATDAVAIRKYGTNLYISSNHATASGASGAPNSFLVADGSDPITSGKALWNLEGTGTALPEGVYCFKNNGNSGMWMDTQHDSTEPGAYIQQYRYSNLPINTFSRGALFKVSYTNDQDDALAQKCIIRSMLNNTLSFRTLNGDVITKTISDVDQNVASSDTYYIRFYHRGFIIQSVDTDYLIAPIETDASGSAGAPDSYLTTTRREYNEDQAYWKPYRYTGTVKSGFVLYHPTYWSSTGIVVGDNTSASLLSWTTVINSNRPYMTVTSGYKKMASESWNASTYRLSLTAKEPGALRISTYSRIGNTTATSSGSSTYVFFIVPQEGTYCIENEATKKYIEIEGQSSSEGAIIQQLAFHLDNNMKWIIEHVDESNGYVRIKSKLSGRYIGVDSSDTSTIRQTSSLNDYTLWRIQYTDSLNYSLACKAVSSTNLVLAVGSPTAGNGTDLTQIIYTNNTILTDEWNLYLLEYTATLNNLYDKGYYIRYGETATTSEQLIEQYSVAVAEIYMKEFGLELHVNEVEYFLSGIDECKGTVSNFNIDDLCVHSGTCHTDRESVKSNFSSSYSGNNVTIYALWSGHRIVSIGWDGEPDYNRSFSSGYYIYLLDAYDSGRAAKSKSLLMHELNHQFGAKDHYHEENDEGKCKNASICSECSITGYPSTCIMNDGEMSITSSSVLCMQCWADISAHLDEHH